MMKISDLVSCMFKFIFGILGVEIDLWVIVILVECVTSRHNSPSMYRNFKLAWALCYSK